MSVTSLNSFSLTSTGFGRCNLCIGCLMRWIFQGAGYVKAIERKSSLFASPAHPIIAPAPAEEEDVMRVNVKTTLLEITPTPPRGKDSDWRNLGWETRSWRDGKEQDLAWLNSSESLLIILLSSPAPCSLPVLSEDHRIFPFFSDDLLVLATPLAFGLSRV
eukprot:767883-Hanusia_phi.AAC.5